METQTKNIFVNLRFRNKNLIKSQTKICKKQTKICKKQAKIRET
jgi:N-acetylmuramic acid 6-phosphate (MurNAc-6-P) etherase